MLYYWWYMFCRCHSVKSHRNICSAVCIEHLQRLERIIYGCLFWGYFFLHQSTNSDDNQLFESNVSVLLDGLMALKVFCLKYPPTRQVAIHHGTFIKSFKLSDIKISHKCVKLCRPDDASSINMDAVWKLNVIWLFLVYSYMY